jgi:hypothetical protein
MTAYCTTTELQYQTGSELAEEVLEEIIAQADREVKGAIYMAGLTPPGANDLLKAASLNLSKVGVLTRQRMDGTHPSSQTVGDLTISDNIDAAILDLRKQAYLSITAYISQASTTAYQSSRIYKVNG